jgi:hypothetical protein
MGDDEISSYIFADEIDQHIDNSYSDPYDAYHHYETGKNLCLVVRNKVVKIFPTKLISISWAIACCRRILHQFEQKHPNNNKPRQALEKVESWIYLEKTAGAVAILLAKNTVENAIKEAYIIDTEFTYIAFAAAFAVDTLFRIAKHKNPALPACCVADTVVNAAIDKSREIRWQRKYLWQIIYEPYFELVKINYHDNFLRLGLDKPFPFRDLGQKIREY